MSPERKASFAMVSFFTFAAVRWAKVSVSPFSFHGRRPHTSSFIIHKAASGLCHMAFCAFRSMNATFKAPAMHVMLSSAPVALSCALEINYKFYCNELMWRYRRRIVQAQLEGSGRGSLGSYDTKASQDIDDLLHSMPLKDGDAWISALMQKNEMLGGCHYLKLTSKVHVTQPFLPRWCIYRMFSKRGPVSLQSSSSLPWNQIAISKLCKAVVWDMTSTSFIATVGFGKNLSWLFSTRQRQDKSCS